jgi:hypothetical protein
MRLLRETDTRHLGVIGISMRRDIEKTAPLITHQMNVKAQTMDRQQ